MDFDGLLDVEIATSAFIRFIPVTGSACERDTALLFAGGTRKSIDVTELADWVTAPGRHVVDSTVAELPIGAEMAVHGKSARSHRRRHPRNRRPEPQPSGAGPRGQRQRQHLADDLRCHRPDHRPGAGLPEIG